MIGFKDAAVPVIAGVLRGDWWRVHTPEYLAALIGGALASAVRKETDPLHEIVRRAIPQALPLGAGNNQAIRVAIVNIATDALATGDWWRSASVDQIARSIAARVEDSGHQEGSEFNSALCVPGYAVPPRDDEPILVAL